MEGKHEGVKSYKVIDLVQIALMAAIIFLVTDFIYIPTGDKAVLHLGDTMIFVAAALFGGKKAALSAAIGMSLFDILSPYAMWAPYTFINKGGMGLIAGIVAYRGAYKGNSIKNNILGFVLGGIFMIAGYFVAGNILYGSYILAIKDIPGNILQVAAGIILALPIIKAIKKANVIKG